MEHVDSPSVQSFPPSSPQRPEEACSLLRFVIDSELNSANGVEEEELGDHLQGQGEEHKNDALTRRAAESERLMMIERERAEKAMSVVLKLTREANKEDLKSEVAEAREKIHRLELRLAESEGERKRLRDENLAHLSAREVSDLKIAALTEIIDRHERMNQEKDREKGDESAAEQRQTEIKSLAIEIERLTNLVETLMKEREVLWSSLQLGNAPASIGPQDLVAPSSDATEEIRRKARVAKALEEYSKLRETPI